METNVLMIVIAIALVLNALVTIFLLLRSDLGKSQKIGQIVVVWSVPYLGAIGLWIFNRSHDAVAGPDERPFGGGHGESGSVISGEASGGGD